MIASGSVGDRTRDGLQLFDRAGETRDGRPKSYRNLPTESVGRLLDRVCVL